MRSSSRSTWALTLTSLLVILPLLAGCGGSDKTTAPPPNNNNNNNPPPTTGTISGVVSLPAGVPGDLGNSRVGIFTSLDNWASDIPAMPFSSVSGSGATVQFTLSGVTPGSYFVEVWQDTNRNAQFDGGDWWGISGTSTWPQPTPAMVMVSAGNTVNVSIYLIAIP